MASDHQQIEGTWVQVAKFHGDHPGNAEVMRWHFVAGRLEMVFPDRPPVRREYKLDPWASPRALDLIGGYAKMAYTLQGDTLEICYNLDSPGQRPDDVHTKKPSHVRRVFKRAKK